MKVLIGKDELYPYYYIEYNPKYGVEIDLTREQIRRFKRINKEFDKIQSEIMERMPA